MKGNMLENCVNRKGNILMDHADLVMSCGETNQDDAGKYAVMAVMDHLILQYMKRYYR